MPLKLTIEKLDDVEEAFRPLYEEKDGRFQLAVDGIDDIVAPIKATLSRSQREATERRKKLEQFEKLGKPAEEIEELLKSWEETERKKAEEAGDHAKILKQHQDKWIKEKSDLEAELNAARSSERNAIIGNSIMTSLNKEGATEEGIDLLPDRLASRIKFETKDGKRILKIVQADGETPMAGNGPEGSATIDDLVKEAQQKWPSLFKGRGNSGGGSQPPTAGGGKLLPGGAKSKKDLNTPQKLADFVNAFPTPREGMQAYQSLPDGI
jgi:hypothetical protein